MLWGNGERGMGHGTTMIHHYSIAVHDPENVSEVLARLFDGRISRFGPYPNSYIVWLGDEHGSAIELFPAGTELHPDEGQGQANFRHNKQHSKYSATHAAISISRTREEIFAIAKEQNWQAIELSRGGFNVIEFWIENKIMVELLTPDMARDYLSLTVKYQQGSS